MKLVCRILCLLLASITVLSAASCLPYRPPQSTEPSSSATATAPTTTPATNPETDPAIQPIPDPTPNQNPVPDPDPMPDPNTPSAEIDLQTVYLYVGDSYTLPYTRNENTTDKDVLPWNSSHNCVTVENGVIKAVKEGYSFVSAGGTSYCHVRVLPKTLPNLSVWTNGAEIDSNLNYTDCLVTVSSESFAFNQYSLRGGIRLRGNSTIQYPKKPFRLKFENEQNLLGLNGGAKCKSWVLLAEYLDDSFIRNATALSIASVVLEEYSSDWCYVNLYVDNEHLGVYVLCEQSQINENRVDIEEAGKDSADLHSGYFFELEGGNPPETRPHISYDHYDFDLLHFYSGNPHSQVTTNTGEFGNLYFEFKNDGLSKEQEAFATKYFQSIFDVLCYATYANKYYAIDRETGELIPSDATSAEEAISAVIDVDSVARMYILGEIMCNNDEHYKSFYFWFDLSENGTGKLTFGCPWDFDGATVTWNTDEWRPTNQYFSAKRSVLYAVITYNDFFRARVRELWEEFYQNTNGFENILSVMSETFSYYGKDFDADARIWERDDPQYVWCDMTISWLRERIAWFNDQIKEKFPKITP